MSLRNEYEKKTINYFPILRAEQLGEFLLSKAIISSSLNGSSKIVSRFISRIGCEAAYTFYPLLLLLLIKILIYSYFRFYRYFQVCLCSMLKKIQVSQNYETILLNNCYILNILGKSFKFLTVAWSFQGRLRKTETISTQFYINERNLMNIKN